ncbi:MAG: SDR family oxidoreductase [Crocinitomicaceae bacterium]|nr:SDR family oxidoreductase [Crocinitomicaceae bacterium]
MEKTTKTALITGASSGIGYELALIHAKNGDDVILVARREDKLNELKFLIHEKYPVKVEVIALDLAQPESPKILFDTIVRMDATVEYLINNAGFGDYGKFTETNWEKEQQMIQLNILALTELTKLYLPLMVERKSGHVMNVASIASFLPGPLMAVYYATKAYVLHFSEAINNEVADHNVSVTALCPGPTISGFQDAANLGDSKFFQSNKFPSSKEVAEYGYQAMLKKKVVAIHGASNRWMVFFLRLIPRAMVVKMVRKLQGKK